MGFLNLFRAKKAVRRVPLQYDTRAPERESSREEDEEDEQDDQRRNSASATCEAGEELEEPSGLGIGSLALMIVFGIIGLVLLSAFSGSGGSGTCGASGTVMHTGYGDKHLYNTSDMVDLTICTSTSFMDELVKQGSNISSLVILGIIMTVLVGLMAAMGGIFYVFKVR